MRSAFSLFCLVLWVVRQRSGGKDALDCRQKVQATANDIVIPLTISQETIKTKIDCEQESSQMINAETAS